MRLAFSTNYHEQLDIENAYIAATEYKFSGIEFHDARGITETDISRMRELSLEKGVSVPCIDMVADPSADKKQADEELDRCIYVAKRLRSEFVRVRASKEDGVEEFLREAVLKAEKEGIILLVETVGAYANSEKLRDLLSNVVSDSLAVLWDFHYPYRICGESPEKTITNLGAYVKHVHIKDSGDDGNYCLVGEGTLPIEEFMNALRSINYDGYVAIEWDAGWDEEITDLDIIFPHFYNVMQRYSNLSRAKSTLYDNGYGKYVWKKDILIEKTFGDVLDTMVKEFPDQYAIKYTTLDYTRTYSQFRDDVDEFARALIALGVKKGSHVAVWATNVPEWYIAFWATTKIGAVLVTVYRIQNTRNRVFAQAIGYAYACINRKIQRYRL